MPTGRGEVVDRLDDHLCLIHGDRRLGECLVDLGVGLLEPLRQPRRAMDRRPGGPGLVGQPVRRRGRPHLDPTSTRSAWASTRSLQLGDLRVQPSDLDQRRPRCRRSTSTTPEPRHRPQLRRSRRPTVATGCVGWGRARLLSCHRVNPPTPTQPGVRRTDPCGHPARTHPVDGSRPHVRRSSETVAAQPSSTTGTPVLRNLLNHRTAQPPQPRRSRLAVAKSGGDVTEVAALEVLVGLHHLGLGVHHERAGPGERFTDRAPADHDHVHAPVIGSPASRRR